MMINVTTATLIDKTQAESITTVDKTLVKLDGKLEC